MPKMSSAKIMQISVKEREWESGGDWVEMGKVDNEARDYNVKMW